MAVARFPLEEIKKSIKLDESTLEKINSLGMPAVVKDNELEVEIFPNRPEMFAYTHFLNAVKMYLGKEKPKNYRVLKPQKEHLVTIHSSLKGIREFGAYAIIKDLKLDDQRLKQLIAVQEKISTTTGRDRKKLGIGIFPCEKIKFPLLFTAKDPKDIKFVPLGETKELDAKTILKTHPVGKEYAHLLENLNKYPVLLDANNAVLTMPPITNSELTGRVTPSTKEILVEVSGTNETLVKKVLNILVLMFADMQGTIQAITLKTDKSEVVPDLKPEKRKILLENVKKILGLEIKEKELASLLGRMGYQYEKGNVLVPAYRTDVLHEVDIIEDLAIAYGYGNIPYEIPRIATIGELDPKSPIRSKIVETLIGLGALEISTHHLIKTEEADLVKIDPITVESSKTDYKHLRSDLVIPLLRIMSENKDRDYPQRVFELGKVFSRDDSETGVKESEHLSLGLAPGNFTEMKQHLEALVRAFGLQGRYQEKSKKLLIEGRSASINVGNKEIGYLGEVHPNALKEWGIKMPLAIAEIDIDELIKLVQPK